MPKSEIHPTRLISLTERFYRLKIWAEGWAVVKKDERPRIITLTTDFGERDGYVGVMRGVILGIASNVQLVDLSHEVPPQDIRSGAFVLYQALSYFPADAIHICVVDPGVGSERRALAVRTSLGFFVAPDNGVLSYVYTATNIEEAVMLTNPLYQLPQINTTFHGRDIFAPAAAHLANGIPLRDYGPHAINLTKLDIPAPDWQPDGTLIAHVMHIDHFGNLILDAKASDLARSPKKIKVGGLVLHGLTRTFADVATGEPLVYVGSCRDHLEFAIRNGNAASTYRLQIGDPIIFKS